MGQLPAGCAHAKAAKRRRPAARLLWALLACGAWTSSALATGGHFAVDDAALLEVGQCQLETWLERHGDARTLLHLGPACRVGPVELGLNGDRAQRSGHGPESIVGPQVKWAAALDARWSVGVVALAGWTGNAVRYAGHTLYLPVTYALSPSLAAHLNVGRDWAVGSPSRGRGGVALEWQATPAWAAIGEAYAQSGAHFARLGMRWQPSPALGFDLSRAIGTGSTSAGWWTLGVNITYGDPRY